MMIVMIMGMMMVTTIRVDMVVIIMGMRYLFAYASLGQNKLFSGI